MADANFHNGRLRLAAFLRVVESDMPKRPSRFKRRFHTPEEGLQEPNGPPVLEEAELITKQEEIGAPTGSDAAKHMIRPDAVPLPSEYDLPRSMSPDQSGPERSHSHADFARSANTGTPEVDEPQAVKHRKHLRKKPDITQSPSNTRVAKVPGRSSATRKRRLPVIGLALLRTTTSDGLPEPAVGVLQGNDV